MEDDTTVSNEETGAQQQGQERRIQLRDIGNATTYASFFSISAAQDAILFNFGNQLGQPDVVQLETKVVLSPRNAKRLAVSLGHVIRRHEEQHGEIDIRPPAQPAPAQGGRTGQP